MERRERGRIRVRGGEEGGREGGGGEGEVYVG